MRYAATVWHRVLNTACVLLGLAALPACTTLFDAPKGSPDVHRDVSAKVMGGLVEAEQKADAVIPGGLQEVGTMARGAVDDPTGTATGAANKFGAHAANSAADHGRTAPNSPPPQGTTAQGRVMPSISFERVDADMPQLAVWGLDEAVVRVDGEKMELGRMTRAGRIGLVAPGRHKLRVECPRDPPFSADFYLEKGDRIVLRGNCSPSGRSPTGR